MSDATSDAESTDDAEEALEELPQPFENRAARAAKGKATASHTGRTTGRVRAHSGTVKSPRQYGNRRSG